MPVWCPECNTLLAEGTEECPRCGTLIKEPEAESWFRGTDIAWFSAYTIAIMLIPILIGVGIALLCLLVLFDRA